MAGQTPRFKLNYFGSGTPGTPNDDGQKFFGLDRLTLDRLLAAIESHDHRVHPAEVAPTDPLAAELVTGSGNLQGGYTYHYRYAVVDAQGNESIASPEITVATPALLPMPGMPAAYVTAGGSQGLLAPGIYYYALTALRGTEETPLGPATLIQLQQGDGSVTLTLPAFGEADAFRVWRMGSTEPGYTRIGLVSAGTEEFVDVGAVAADPCACDPGNAPPPSNTGTSSYGVRLTLPDVVDVTAIRSWRIYRTMYAGIYPAAALVHDVVEREEEWNPFSPLLTEWIDTGAATLIGKPQDHDLNMRFQPLALEVLDDLPDPGHYPIGYPIVSGETLNVNLDGQWTPVGGGGGGGSMTGIMTSPNGSRFILKVDDTGALITEPTNFPGPPPAPTGLRI